MNNLKDLPDSNFPKGQVNFGFKKTKRISFDFDNTLQNPALQTLAKGFIEDGHEVFIITSRLNEGRILDVCNLAVELGIPQFMIYRTNGESKVLTIKVLGIDIHFDDCPFECAELRSICTVIQVEPFILNEE